ncbi:MAG: hypothetical protein E7381_00065 [Clostridiales bacterium]|nr:hypothetical protein [Clostridiales bacterium]
MRLFALRQKMAIEGVMPERALLKLRLAQIDLFDVKKPQKNRLVFTVARKDVQKVFAIYPNVCYNKNGYASYTAENLGAVGITKCLDFAKKRVGFLLGAFLFFIGTLALDEYIFGIDFVGSDIYAREARMTLSEYGVKPFARYKSGNEDLICSKLLSLDGVEFCSVQKNGLRVRVEMRIGEYGERKLQEGDFISRYTGEILAITALRGTPLKAKGDKVEAGERLVGGWFLKDEEQIRVAPIARVQIACVYEGEYFTQTAENAFAEAYLTLALKEDDSVTDAQVQKNGDGYLVRIEYTVTESINF